MGIQGVPVTNLMLVVMAGVMSGALYAPLTAIFLIAESSSDYDLFIPLMIVSVIAYAINRFFSPVNPTLGALAKEGNIFTTQQGQSILSHIVLADCINPSTLVISTLDSMDEVLTKFRNSNQNTMTVLDNENKFWGILNRDQLRPYLLGKQPTSESSISKLTLNPSFTVSPDDPVMEVAKMFDEADVWLLPILDHERNFQGSVSRSRILTRYRALLKEFSE